MSVTSRQAQASREQRMLHAIAFASETLLRAPRWQERVDPVLRQLGEATDASRVYLFGNRTESGRVLTTQMAEWVAEGVEPQIDNPALTDFDMVAGGYQRWIDILGRGEIVSGRTHEFPPDEQEFLTAQNIRSVAVAPIHVADRWWGFVGFDDCIGERAWTREEREILASTARILAAAIERTEREDREQAHAEQRLRLAVEGARIGTWDYFPLTGESTRSERCRETLGLPPGADMSLETFESILHAEDRAAMREALARALDPDGTGEYAVEFRVVHPDGSSRAVAARGQAMFDEIDGRRTALRLSGVLIDQTEQVRAREMVEEKAETLRAVFDGAAMGIALFDAQGSLLSINAALEQMFGYGAAELRRLGVAGVTHPDDMEQDQELFAELIEGKRASYRLEKRYIHRSGEMRWGRLSVSRVDLPAGPHAVAMVEDITERKLTVERLRESEERFRLLAERVREVFYVTETDPLRLVYISPGFEDLWQQKTEVVHADVRRFIDAIHPEDQPRVIAAFERQMRGEETAEEYRVVRPDGSLRWVRDRAYPVASGGRLRIVGLAEDITGSKLADQQIRASQERYELLARATNDVIWDWDFVSNRVDWNEALTVTLGYDLHSIPKTADWWYEHLHPDDRQRIVTGIHAAIDGTASFWSDEYRFARANGQWATVFDRGYIARDSGGKAFRMIGAMIDLTDRKKVEAELRTRDLRYRSLVESSTQIVWTTDADGMIEDMPIWRALTGQTLEEVRGAGWVNALHPEDRERTWNTWDHAYRTRSIYDAEYRIRMRDGSYRWFAARGIPVIDEDGTLREWVGTCGDVDERRRAENALTFLSDASATLASSLDYEETLRRIAGLAVPRLADWCAVDLRTEDGGYERLAVEHRDPDKRSLARELWRRYSGRTGRLDLIAEVIRTGKPVLLEQISDELLREAAYDDEHLSILQELGLRSAIVVPLIVGAAPPIGAMTFVSAESGRAYGESDLSVADDLVRRASMAIENARLYRAAQEANRAKDEFLATLSHELRTPLTAILGWAKILSDDRADPELLSQGLETIHRSAVVQARLIDDVLDVSRIISGKLRLEPQALDVTGVVDTSLEAVSPAAQAKQIAVRVHHEYRGLTVLADPNRLQQIVWNLLSNAIKFTDPGGRVDVTTGVDGEAALITVRDTGHGIAAEFLPHMFEPFRQWESSTTRVHGGLGLGLAIVRYLVESHGGRVSAFSEGIGRGAQFTIELPLRPAAHEPAGIEGPLSQATADSGISSADLTGVRLLFVDDQEDTREFAAVALRRHGAQVSTAGSVEEALELFTHEPFDVVVSDIAMPGRDGYQLIGALRGELQARLPVIAISAFGRLEDIDRARGAGFDTYVRKPVDPRELVRAVSESMGVRR